MHTFAVQSRRIALIELAEPDFVQWRMLAARALEPNPFFEPEYVLPLARGLGQEDEVEILVIEDGSAWQACMPIRSSRWHRIPLRSRSTWRGHVLYGLLGTPLVAPERATEAVEALLDAAAGGDRRPAFVAIDWVGEGGPIAERLDVALGKGRRHLPFERFERAALRRRAEPTYVEDTLSSKHRRELRRQRRKLGEALDAEPATIDRADDHSMLEHFVALEAAGRKAASGTVLASDPGHARFFIQMCRGFAEQGRLQVLSLQAGERILALKINVLAGETIFCLKIAYDESWSSLSPGIQLELDALKFFHEAPQAKLMDSCADPRNPMINRLWPDRRQLVSHVTVAGGPGGLVTTGVIKAARGLREQRRTRREHREPTD